MKRNRQKSSAVNFHQICDHVRVALMGALIVFFIKMQTNLFNIDGKVINTIKIRRDNFNIDLRDILYILQVGKWQLLELLAAGNHRWPVVWAP